MHRVLTDGDIDAICHRLTEFSGLNPEEHRNHHMAFTAYIESQKRKAEFWEKVKQQLGGWMIISIITAIGYSAWMGFLWVVQRGH